MSERCQQCGGCGLVDDGEGVAWTYWENLPVKSAVAVVAGIVKPITCPACNGKGRRDVSLVEALRRKHPGTHQEVFAALERLLLLTETLCGACSAAEKHLFYAPRVNPGHSEVMDTLRAAQEEYRQCKS